MRRSRTRKGSLSKARSLGTPSVQSIVQQQRLLVGQRWFVGLFIQILNKMLNLKQVFRSFSTAKYSLEKDIPATVPKKFMNMMEAINNALDIAMETDQTAKIFGEDVKFGGVFRCAEKLYEKYGEDRVFNTPLCEQGIIAFAIGIANVGHKAIPEIQFGDYIFPAFDQLVNEAAKSRFRTGGGFTSNITVRTTWGAVGHGGLYHSQSPQAYFAHTPGLKVVVPRDPAQAKGLLLAAIRDPNPVIFFEPKALYRNAEGDVPTEDYELALHKADVVRQGKNITLIGYGNLIRVLKKVATMAQKQGIDCQIIDLQTIYPYDAETLIASVKKTGRCLITHEAPISGGIGGELAAMIQSKCFLHLQAPIERVCGYDTPFPGVHEPFYLPDEWKIFEAVKRTINY